MNKQSRKDFVEKKLQFNRYAIHFSEPVAISALKNHQMYQEKMTIIYMNNQKTYIDLEISHALSLEQLSTFIQQVFQMDKSQFEIINKGEGLSNLFPL